MAAVAFSPEPGTFTAEQQVALSCGTPDAVIRYTLDGKEPDDKSPAYESPVTISEPLTITAKAFLTDWTPSDTANAKYVITGSVAAVAFSPEPGTFTSEQQVALSCGTPDAVIRYTLDGSEPNETSTAYESPVTVGESLTITAKAFLTDWTPSDTASAQYIITGSVGAVTFSPEPGTFTSEQQVALSCGTPDAVIRYTLDGSEPNETSTAYEAPVTVHESLTITAKAFLTDWAPSDTANAKYVITGSVAAVAFSPEPGTFTSEQQVALSCGTPDAVIRYTLDGKEPDDKSPAYESPVTISESLTITAKAFLTDWAPSEAASAQYHITGQVAAVAFSPEPGTFTSEQQVALSCGTPDAVIRYTLDGSEPNETSTAYEAPVTVHESLTITAKAFLTDWTPSEAANAKYIITGSVGAVTFSPEPGTFTSEQQVALSCETPDAVIRYTLDGSEPNETSTAYEAPVTVGEPLTISAKAFLTDWTPSDTASAQYIITGSVGAVTFSPEPGTFTSEQQVALSCGTPDAVIRYTLDGSEPNETSTAYEAPVTVHESLTITAKAFLTDWAPSDTANAKYVITGSVAAVAFSPEPGTFTSEQQVALSCGTPDAVIWFTLDGKEPDDKSPAYESPVTISESLTITAKAFLTDWAPSEAASAQYHITGQVSTPNIIPQPGTYKTDQEIYLTCPTPGAVIRYTLDETEPTENSKPYKAPIEINKSTMIKVRALLPDWAPSEIITAVFEVTGTVSAPIVSPAPGTYHSSQQVALSCDTPGAVIRFTLDGAEPGPGSPVYDTPVEIYETTIVKARAFLQDWEPSRVIVGAYILEGDPGRKNIDFFEPLDGDRSWDELPDSDLTALGDPSQTQAAPADDEMPAPSRRIIPFPKIPLEFEGFDKMAPGKPEVEEAPSPDLPDVTVEEEGASGPQEDRAASDEAGVDLSAFLDSETPVEAEPPTSVAEQRPMDEEAPDHVDLSDYVESPEPERETRPAPEPEPEPAVERPEPAPEAPAKPARKYVDEKPSSRKPLMIVAVILVVVGIGIGLALFLPGKLKDIAGERGKGAVRERMELVERLQTAVKDRTPYAKYGQVVNRVRTDIKKIKSGEPSAELNRIVIIHDLVLKLWDAQEFREVPALKGAYAQICPLLDEMSGAGLPSELPGMVRSVKEVCSQPEYFKGLFVEDTTDPSNPKIQKIEETKRLLWLYAGYLLGDFKKNSGLGE